MPSKNAGLARAYGAPTKPASAKGAKPQRKAKAGSSNNALVRRLVCDKICAVCDPVCPQACGSKMMGQDTSRTFSFTSKSVITLTTQAGGEAARFFTPGIESITAVHTGIVSDVVTWGPASDLPEASALQASGTSYRVVSAALRVFSIAAPTNSSGRVQVTQVNTQGAGTPTGFNVASLLYEEVDTDSLYAFDKTYVFRREGAEASTFESTTSNVGHRGWNGLVVSVTGGPTNLPVLQFEVTYNLEIQPDPITVYSHIADPPARHVPALEAAVANVSRIIPMGGDSESWSAKLMKFAQSEATALIQQYGAKELLAMIV